MSYNICKDCIFSKYIAHPFNDTRQLEVYIFEHVYLNIWGPVPVHSAGGAVYFMALTDSFSPYQTMVFLSGKLADIILKVFKAYHIEAKRYTGWKLKKVQLDMGRKWYNNVWEKYKVENRIKFELTIPYAH